MTVGVARMSIWNKIRKWSIIAGWRSVKQNDEITNGNHRPLIKSTFQRANNHKTYRGDANAVKVKEIAIEEDEVKFDGS